MSKPIKHVVISRTDGIGDVVLSLPIAGALKAFLPEVQVTFLGRGYTREVVACCADVDAFVDWDLASGLHPAGQAEFMNALNADAVIHAFPRKEVVYAASRAKIPIRVGTARRFHTLLRVNRPLWFSRKHSTLHEAALNLRMLHALGIKAQTDDASIEGFMRLRPQVAVPELATRFCAKERSVLLHPLSHGSAVDWPLSCFGELAVVLSDAGFTVGITGTGSERERMADGLPWERVTDFCGQLSLAELIAVVAESGGLVAGSTGPLHIAAALGVHALGLYSPQPPIFPTRWRPIGKNAGYIASARHPDDGRLAIRVEEVHRKILGWFP